MYGMKKPAKPKLIKGPGTGTSDSIQKEVPEGTYIMPADSTQALGAAKPKGKQAQQQTRKIGVSNGEMEIPPEAVQQIGAAVLDQVRDATHAPVGAGFKPKSQRQKPEMFFADGGLVDNFSESVGGYWSADNARFEAGNPTTLQRVGRSLNPVTGFGSAIGSMYDAASHGDVAGMGLAAVQSVPAFAATRAVGPALKTAVQQVPSLARTSAAIAGGTGASVAADQYQPRQEPIQGFADGGLVGDDEELRRSPVAGYAENVQRNREALGNAADSIKTVASYSAPALGYRAAKAVGQKAADIVTGRDPITFDSNLPDYGAGERQRAAQKFVRTQPEQAAAANEYGAQVAERTLNNGLAPPGGYPGIARADTAKMAEAEQQAAEQERQAGSRQAQAGGQQAAGPVADSTNEWGRLGYGGIVGRRNKDGVQEFSNMQGDVEAAGNRQFNGEGSTVGDGKGQLSILTGFGANAENYRRASELRAQTRLEQSNPNYLTVVRDEGAGGVRGLVNARLNRQEEQARAERTRQHQQDVAAGRQRLAESERRDIENQRADLEQQWAVEDRAVTTEDRQRLRALRDQMMDTSLDAAQRIEARRQYMALTVDAGDRYKAESVQYGTDADGKPVLGNRLVDVTSGEFVTGEPATPPRRSVTRAEVEEAAKADGADVEAYLRQLQQQGVQISG